jgi:hypothetical protein
MIVLGFIAMPVHANSVFHAIGQEFAFLGRISYSIYLNQLLVGIGSLWTWLLALFGWRATTWETAFCPS